MYQTTTSNAIINNRTRTREATKIDSCSKRMEILEIQNLKEDYYHQSLSSCGNVNNNECKSDINSFPRNDDNGKNKEKNNIHDIHIKKEKSRGHKVHDNVNGLHDEIDLRATLRSTIPKTFRSSNMNDSRIVGEEGEGTQVGDLRATLGKSARPHTFKYANEMPCPTIIGSDNESKMNRRSVESENKFSPLLRVVQNEVAANTA